MKWSLPIRPWKRLASGSAVRTCDAGSARGMSRMATKRGSSATTAPWVRTQDARASMNRSKTDRVLESCSARPAWSWRATRWCTTASESPMTRATMPTVNASILPRRPRRTRIVQKAKLALAEPEAGTDTRRSW